MADYNSSAGSSENFTATDVVLTDFPTATDDYGDYTFVSTNTALLNPCEGNALQETYSKVVQVTVFLIVLVLGVIGNVLVIATFARYRCLRVRCMTDVFLFYLALSDLLLLLTLPLQTVETIRGDWVFGDVLCKLNHAMHAINTYGGLLLLACISVDRYLVVVRARAAHRLHPSMLCHSKLSVIAVALISVILSLPELLFSSVVKVKLDDMETCGMNIWVKDSRRVKKWARVAKITVFCIPCVVMLVCYMAIGYKLVQGGRKCWRRQRTLLLMVALVVLFLLFQLPYNIVLTLRETTDLNSCELWGSAHLSEDITRSLAYVRCCLNPVLYALVGVRFRNDVMRLLQDCGCVCACLKHMKPLPTGCSSMTPSSPPPTTLSPLPSASGPPKNLLACSRPSQPQADAEESRAPDTLLSSAQQSHKDPAYVSWGQH
ncbi:C-C chemokine receptor type 10 [Pygocentrus nattereri]|uniref:G-protein coupled receptors family 1 profile domain-containing protein n=1 Tax=Pygocentrus nattereri TaxID=42514 RepID=A0A3B4CAJ7_PYGNA|nr:C-C chemokine receptor type 10 [Pygocentrus nattereri]